MSLKDLKDKYAIVGVGYAPQGRVPNRTAVSLYVEACVNAVKDAGLRREDIDGLILYRAFPTAPGEVQASAYQVGYHLGLSLHALSQEADCCRAQLFTAIGWLEAGLCNYVVIAYADNPLSSGTDFLGRMSDMWSDMNQLAFGHFGATSSMAMMAQRDIHTGHSSGPEAWKEIAVGIRRWANLNPIAMMHDRILTFNDYYNARWVVEPFRLYDNCLINDGGRAFVLTSTERARDLKHRPAIIMGMGYANPCCDQQQLKCTDRPSGIKTSGEMAFKMAGITINDVDACEPYDCFTWGVESDLMDYGFFGPGEGADWFKGGTIAPGGRMPMATSGGLLSEAYYMGVTPLTEAAMQLMGRCGDRQLGPKTNTKEPEIILCWDKGGFPQGSLSTTILRRW